MSRSYKKHMGGSYCGGSDKYSRSVYHRSKRRSDKKYCYELCKKYEIQQIFERESNFCLECMLFSEEICSGDWAYCPYQTIDDLPTDKIVSVVDYSWHGRQGGVSTMFGKGRQSHDTMRRHY